MQNIGGGVVVVVMVMLVLMLGMIGGIDIGGRFDGGEGGGVNWGISGSSSVGEMGVRGSVRLQGVGRGDVSEERVVVLMVMGEGMGGVVRRGGGPD